MTTQRNITLIGMPGAGKSTLGVVAAKKFGMRFVDTDLLIQEGTGKLLSQLIDERGAEGFIELENRTIAGLECTGHVIATGGSAVYGEQAMQHVRSLSTVVFLDAPLEELRERLNMDLLERGVVCRGCTTLAELFAERRPLYLRHADVVLETAGLSTHEAVEELAEALEQTARLRSKMTKRGWHQGASE